jgi:uncharacterized membrane protein
LISVALIVVTALVPDSLIRTILGLPFVLFFPGYSLISALYPEKTALGRMERLALSIGLSLAVVPLIGLGLNYTPWGIRLVPIIISLTLFTASLSLLAIYRRSALAPDNALALSFHGFPKLAKITRLDKFFFLAIIAAIVMVGSLTAYLGAAPKAGDQFTEFYILDFNGKLTDYPQNLTLGQNGTVITGIINHEDQDITYRITISLENKTLATIDNIQVQNSQNWTRPYTFTPDKIGAQMKLEFQLFKEGIDVPYRHLQLLITVRDR